MWIQFKNLTITSDRFIALMLAFVIIYLLYREIDKYFRKKIRDRKQSEQVSRILLWIFLFVICVFLLNYVFRWF